MADFSSIDSLKAAEEASRQGLLVRILLLPESLGGEDRPGNVVYVPPHAVEALDGNFGAFVAAISSGMDRVSVVPAYRGRSFVPARLTITAAAAGQPPGYICEIEVW